jgi:hypothetical protein
MVSVALALRLAKHRRGGIYLRAYSSIDPLAEGNPGEGGTIDRTIAFGAYLWDLGVGVAEAMDTAQRGTGLATSRGALRTLLFMRPDGEGSVRIAGTRSVLGNN